MQRVETPPWFDRESTSMIVTPAIFALNVAVFLGMLFAGVAILDNPAGQDLVRWGANFGPYTVGGEWWRLVTCLFVHGGFLHIAFNMWCLWSLGSLAESLYGHWTFAGVYLIAGVSASVASIVWHPNALSVGASGAIFGIAGALAASFYLGEFSLPRAAVMGTLRSVAVFIGYSLIFGAMSGRTDNAAHVGGLVGGLILGALIAKVAPRRDGLLRRVGVLLVGAALACGGIAWLRYARADASRWSNAEQFLAQGSTDQAIAEMQRLLERRPEAVPVRIELARAYARKHDYQNAEAELKRALAIEPKSQSAAINLGFVLRDENRLPEARQAFAQVLASDPKSVPAHFGMAAVLSREAKYPEALEEYKRIAQLDPASGGLYYSMGVTQVKMKQYDDAIASFRKEQEISGDDAEIESALAAAYEAKGWKKEATVASRKATDLRKQR